LAWQRHHHDRRRRGLIWAKGVGCGDRRSGRIQHHAALSLIEEKPDMTLAELHARLAEKRIGVGIGTLWRFSKHAKGWRMLPSGCFEAAPAPIN
jgi:hypothetical protein